MPRKVINIKVLETHPSTINLVPEFVTSCANQSSGSYYDHSLFLQTSAELISDGDFGDDDYQNG